MVDTANHWGKIRKSVSVYSNDPAKRRERLMLEASIKRAIKIVPSGIVTLSGKRGETKIKDLFISSVLDKPLEIKPQKFTLKGKVNYSLKVIKAKKEYKISFRNNPDVAGNFHGYLKLGTNYRGRSEIIIRINSVFN